MKYLIVGLGNPGAKYEKTRHNIGFKVLDSFAEDTKAEFGVERLGNVARAKFKGRTVVLLQPSTFMNLSGKALNYWMQQEKVDIDRVLIITDDLALPFGKLRMKGKGSDGGHNGLKDIIAVLNHNKFPRLRFGVGDEFTKGTQVDYVLGEWSDQERETLDERIGVAKEFIKSFVTIGIERTMNHWNNK
jgi:PTH1 family peptidyl-tRNA hydrolase